ncbi:MAG: PH domain-containing protein [Reyranella sp.]|nr:PH domain-containing protein [Reyranella sp.]
MSSAIMPDPVSPKSGHGRAFLARHLKKGETVIAAEHAYVGRLMGRGGDRQHNGELIVTTERVAFYRKRLLGGEILRTIPIDKITAVDRQSNAVWAWIEIHTSHEKIAVGFPRKGDDLVYEAIERARDIRKAA